MKSLFPSGESIQSSGNSLIDIVEHISYRPEKAGQEGRLVTHIARAKKLTGMYSLFSSVTLSQTKYVLQVPTILL